MAERARVLSAGVDMAGAVKNAAIAALLAFGLFLPLIGFKTEQDIRNELALETRWPLLFTFVAIVAAAHLFGSLVITPWRQARALKHVPSATASRLRGSFVRWFLPLA